MSTPKSPNGFRSILVRKSAMELLGSKYMTEIEGRGLPDTTGAKKQGLSSTSRAEGLGLPGSPKPEVLCTIIKMRFTKLMLIIKLIAYLYQR